MKKTFKELQEIDILVGGLYQRNPKLRDSKFGYAYKRFTDKNYVPHVREFNEELSALRVQHALEHPSTKEVMVDLQSPRGYKYSKSELINLMGAEKRLQDEWDKKEFDITPFLSATIPDELEEEHREMLAGIVL